MSYCRWSSDGYQCPLYCYESETGFITHVATRKPIVRCPELMLIAGTTKYANWDTYQEWIHTERNDDDYINYDLPYDGQTFEDDSLEEMRDRILMLEAAGYEIPEWVIPNITAEIDEE